MIEGITITVAPTGDRWTATITDTTGARLRADYGSKFSIPTSQLSFERSSFMRASNAAAKSLAEAVERWVNESLVEAQAASQATTIGQTTATGKAAK